MDFNNIYTFGNANGYPLHISCLIIYYSAPVGVRSIAIRLSVRLFVCLSARLHISGTAGSIVTKFSVQIPSSRGSVLLRRRCAMLCTSGFTDDVTFGRNGRDVERWRLHSATAINDVYKCLF